MRGQSTEDAGTAPVRITVPAPTVAEMKGEQLEAFVQRVRGHLRPPFSHGFLLLDS